MNHRNTFPHLEKEAERSQKLPAIPKRCQRRIAFPHRRKRQNGVVRAFAVGSGGQIISQGIQRFNHLSFYPFGLAPSNVRWVSDASWLPLVVVVVVVLVLVCFSTVVGELNVLSSLIHSHLFFL